MLASLGELVAAGSAGRRGVRGPDQLLASERGLMGVISGDVSGVGFEVRKENSTSCGPLTRRAS